MTNSQPLDPGVVHTVIALIPEGCVASYGQIAALAGAGRRSRWVGQVLARLPADSQLPWHRVVNSQGVITCPGKTVAIERLIAEGIEVTNGRVAIKRYRWQPGE